MPTYKELSFAIKGSQKTHVIEVWRDGEPLDLTSLTITATSVKPDGTTYVVPTAAAVSPQIGTDKGRLTITHTAANLDTAGWWILDLRIGAASGTVEPVERRYKFEVQAKVTHA